MISVNDFRTGQTIEVDGEIFTVIDFQHVKPGKGAAFVRSKLRNLRTATLWKARSALVKRSIGHMWKTGRCNICTPAGTNIRLWIRKRQLL